MHLRSHRRRSNPEPMSTTTKVALAAGGVAAVGAIVLLARKASAASVPSLPGPAYSDSVTWSYPDQPSSGQVNFGVDTGMSGIARLTDLYNRLRGDPNALQVYAFQSLMYELRLTDAVPDGVVGPATQGMIRTIQQRANIPVTGTFDPSLIAAIGTVTGYSLGTPVRSIPDTLPPDILASLNSFIASQVPAGTVPFVTANTLPAAPTSG